MSSKKKTNIRPVPPTRAAAQRNGYASGRRSGYGSVAYSPGDERRRYVTLGIIGAGVLVALLVLLFSIEQKSPPPSGQQTANQSSGANIAQLQQRVQQNPEDVDAMVALGNEYYDAKFYSDAITWYEKALQGRPNDTNVRTDLGTAYFYNGQNDKAKDQWNRVLQQDPNKVQAHFNLGIMYASLNPPDNDSAAKEWQTVIKLAPGSPDATEAQKRLQQIGK